MNYGQDSNPEQAKMSLELRIRNFGPISDGRIHVKPLTIFIGDNNSGKSYAAMLVHSILRAESKLLHIPDPHMFVTPSFIRQIKSCENEIASIVKKNARKKEFFMPKLLTDMIARLASVIYQQYVRHEILKNFGAAVEDLVTNDRNSASILFSQPKTSIMLKKELSVRMPPGDGTRHRIRKISKNDDTVTDGNTTTFELNQTYHSDKFVKVILDALIHDACSRMQHAPSTTSHYFPASRSGILQWYMALASGDRTPREHSPFHPGAHYGHASRSIPNLSGTIADLVSNISNIGEQKSPFYGIGDRLENKLFHGNIRVKNSKTGMQEEIRYESGQESIPLQRASSAITEITPISLYLKHVIPQNSMLVIEEPESHLNPKMQLVFVRHIVQMIRAGLNVLITTHSESLLEEMGRFVIAGSLDPGRKKRAGYSKEYLVRDEVSPYRFSATDDIHHTIKRIEMNDDVGINQDEFMDTNRDMYEKYIKLQKVLEDGITTEN